MLKNKMLWAIILFAGLLSFKSEAQLDTTYLKTNLAFVDFRVRSISPDSFVKEILVVDFRQTAGLPDLIAFQDEAFADDGQGYDEKADDGIYTSLVAFTHDFTHPYDANILQRSVYDKAIVDPSFAWNSELKDYLSNYQPPGTQSKFIVKFECDVYWCSCHSSCGGCFIHWGPRAGCVDCPHFYHCHISITWEW